MDILILEKLYQVLNVLVVSSKIVVLPYVFAFFVCWVAGGKDSNSK
jgi:hypothetical protein